MVLSQPPSRDTVPLRPMWGLTYAEEQATVKEEFFLLLFYFFQSKSLKNII
jgi:hypothetical protein